MNPRLEHGVQTAEEDALLAYDTALASAIMGFHVDTILYLLSCYRGDINARFRGQKMLYQTSYFAVSTWNPEEARERIKCVEMLLSRGADASTVSYSPYEYPLHVAIRMANQDLLRTLLQDASPERRLAMFTATNCADQGQRTAHHLAVADRCRARAKLVPVLEELLRWAPKNKGLLGLPDGSGKTPLELAREAEESSAKLVDRLEGFQVDEEEAKVSKTTEGDDDSGWLVSMVSEWWPMI
ncbi:hypothetical protein PWT90_07012 [Aphanocladium album]|nr:hypothetical protein PWT90_07012 [Aphanocladium album]